MKIPVSSFASEANAVTANPTFTKTRRQSIIDLYTDYASDHVNLYVDKGKVKKISRERFERNFLEAIDKSDWPFECKMSTYVSVLMSANFESFWKCVTRDHDLPKSCTTRLVLDMTPVGYEPPTNNEAKGANEVSREADDAVDGEIHDEVHDVAIAAKNISPASEPQIPAPVTDHCGRVSSLDDDASSGSSSLDSEELQAAILQPYKHKPIPHCGRCNSSAHPTTFCHHIQDEEDIDWISDASDEVVGGHEGKMLAKRLFAGLPRGPKPVSDSPPQSNDLHGDSRAIRGDVNRPAREENLHVSNEGFETTKTDKGKAKASSTVKGASKPQGVTKKKPAAKAKEQTAAQLKTAAAKTREPAKPTATKKASTTPSQVATSPAQASYANNMQGQGIKRMLDFFPDEEDEDYSPAAKKAKTGAGASVYGERNMATPKKSNKKTKDLEEWDGTPRGFGEY